MKIGIVRSHAKKEIEEAVERLSDILKKRGHQIVLFSSNEEIAGVDVLLVFGGDGTILHAANRAARENIRVVGINYGTLGFLTEFEKQETDALPDLLDELQAGTCPILKRSMLAIEHLGKTYYGLNEAVIQRDHTDMESQMVELDVKVNGKSTGFVAGDGVLICTPTGSTAYSLSAGGAILSPSVPALMMTWICAFSLSARPTVFSDSDTFSVTVKRGRAMLLVDGKCMAPVTAGMTLEIGKAPFTAEFPMRGNSCFFKKIRTKLNK